MKPRFNVSVLGATASLIFLLSSSCELPINKKKEALINIPIGTGGAAPSTSCSTSVIDTGQKGSVAGVARGAFSDVQIIPGTAFPATAFVDQSALTMKLTHWNGNRYATEVISGDSAATFVRLAILSTGVPIVVWTQGANLKVAIRTAPIGAVGTWSVAVVDTGKAPRAPELAVNPLDQVTLTFLTDTAVAGNAKFLYCDTPCSNPSNFQTMNLNPYIESTAITAAQTATGAGWCKVSDSTYYPVAAYSVTGGTKFAICKNTLLNCLNGANWATQSVVATASLASKIYLDPTVTGDVPKLVSKGATGVSPYKMGNTACTGALGSFTAGPLIGTANTGTQWMTLLKDGTSIFHLLANEGTTGVRYFNSTSTDISAAWNGGGSVDAIALAAAHGGGAALSVSDSAIYTSYGVAAVPFDLRFGRVNDYNQSSSSATFTRFAPDLTGDLQLSALGTQQKHIATASSSTGKIAIAYVDFSVGAVAGAKLKYAYRGSGSASSTWEIALIPGTVNPQYPGLVIDANNRPWISYFDGATNRFFLTTNSSVDGSGSWSTYEFPATPAGAPIALPAANATAMALFSSGGVVDPVMLVIDTNASSKGVKAARFSSGSRSFYAPVVIDSLAAGALGAAHLSTDYNASGLVLAYEDLSLKRAKYSATTDLLIYTAPFAVSSVNQGQGVSIRLHPSTGTPAMSYFDQTNNSVYYNACSSAPALCASSGWTPTQIEGAAGVSGLTLATGQLLSTALRFATDGSATVIYPRGQANDGNLIQANNSTGSFIRTVIGKGLNANQAGVSPLNFGIAGWGVSTSMNASGSFTSVYLGPGSWLYSSSCGD